ncbi:ADP-ribosylglycohydrolase family protein [Thermanaerothrix sp.]|jgi:ADP-ribosylglycohydrolase|uniref:ADP-ribosylglycohydrolase family protein n=1 Tax=Thermanaerothrix sp. TaxID=2972675 RepID=UPI002ADDE7D9|nr:ADP-ribosylglycohydrolase family protein [Thermanaerothrix sp.]
MLNKILGGLYGQALGDAWGMPALLTPEATWEYFGGWIEDFKPAPEHHPVHAGLPAGRVTDDTEQAFALAQAILAERRMTAEGAARALMAWYERVGGDRSPYVGPSTRRAIQALRRGEDLYQVGRFGDTNGAAMRVSPVGLIHPGDPRGAIADAYLSCIPTHHTNVAVSGAAAVAAAIAVAMRPGAELEEIVNAAKDAAIVGLKMGHLWMGASIARRIDLALEIVRGPGDERQRLQTLYDVIGAGLAMTEAVPAAFGVLALAEGDVRRTAIYGAALSGDADTVTAMACAIAGTWQGIEAFDPMWLAQLRRVNPELDFEGVAEGLYDLVCH